MKTKNGKYYKELTVVTLGTQERSVLMIDPMNGIMYSKLLGFDFFDHNKNFRHINKIHLHLISNEKPKEGDCNFWGMNINHDTIYFIKTPLSKDDCFYWRKIVATTQGLEITISSMLGVTQRLPQIPHELLEEYTNSQGKTKQVYVQYENFEEDNLILLENTINVYIEPEMEKKITIEITDEDIIILKRIRDYFGEHDKTQLEHLAYNELDKLINKIQQSNG